MSTGRRAHPIPDRDSSVLNDTEFVLERSDGILALRAIGPNAPGPIAVDWVGGRAAWRRRHGGGRGQAVARAVGLKRGASPRVADLTAGLGADAFVLASLGCIVELVERSPIVADLLRDGHRRALEDPHTAPIAARMCVHQACGTAWLAATETRPDVVYLDPMYPERGKTAAAGKSMRLFRALLGDDADAPALLDAAFDLGVPRITVKRPRRAPPLGGHEPDAQIVGKSTRFDLYLRPSSPSHPGT